LIGKVVNTNANYLAQRLTEAGIVVSRITVLSDDFNDLKKGFQEAIQREPDFIISTGGLGPTWDDRTSEGLALALGVPLERNSKAMEIIKDRYKALSVIMSPVSNKMADLPKGATPIYNSAGTAPGIRIQKGKCIIYCVPGVPKEMKAIFDEFVLPEIASKNNLNKFYQAEFSIQGIGESKLAPITSALIKEFPDIYIKSHPNHPLIIFHITAFGNVETANRLEQVVKILQKELILIGAKLVDFRQ
jgi:molybdenum cofactor synthesis domain-containing protein